MTNLMLPCTSSDFAVESLEIEINTTPLDIVHLWLLF